MTVKIVEIENAGEKSQYAEEILRGLPEWFGNEKSLCEYVKNVACLPFWIALDQDEKCIGFISVKIHYEHTGDIYVLGVLPEYHRKGAGKMLMARAEEYFKENGCRYIIIKTLSEIANYEPYERARKFYKKVGFEELITLAEMWDTENPCLIMIKKI